MNLCQQLFRSSLGKKYLMAVSGAVLFLFVMGHMLGNLQVFLGPEQINAYGHFLQTTPEILWPARVVLLCMVGLHIWAAVTLTLENAAARPIPYAQVAPVVSTYAARTMIWSGLIIAVFIVYHLLHYTVQVPGVNLTGRDFHTLRDTQGRHDVYRMMILGFSNGWVSGFYILGVSLLCLHLSHGVGALFQSLGLKNPAWRLFLDRCGTVAAWVIWAGYLSIPVAIFLGYGKQALQ